MTHALIKPRSPFLLFILSICILTLLGHLICLEFIFTFGIIFPFIFIFNLFINKLTSFSIFLPHQMSLFVNTNDSIGFLVFLYFHKYFIYIFWTYIIFSMIYSIFKFLENPWACQARATVHLFS